LAVIGTVLVSENAISGLWNIEVPFFNLFARWDSAYYIGIAQSGYSSLETIAFRPLFPVLLNLVGSPFSQIVYIDIAIAITGFFINNALFLGALFLIHNLTTRLFSKNIANDTILLVAFYPGAFFYSAIYPESLYLFLIVVTFLFIEKKYFFTSGLIGFFAGLARPEGVFTSIVITLKSLLTNSKQNNKIKGLISAFLAGASTLVVAILAWISFGELGIIFSIESSWDKVTLIQAFNNPTWIMNPAFFSFFAISLPMIILSIATIFPFFIKKSRKILKDAIFPYYVHAAFLVMFFLLVGDLRSLARYFSTIIPIYWTLSFWFRKKPHFKILILILFLLQLALGTILFVNWYPFI
jgi:Gpi18-like mannosyltransferase